MKALLLLPFVALLAGCAGAAGPASSAPPSIAPASAASAKPAASGSTNLETVRFGSLTPSASDAGWLIADKKGYFAEQGIRIEVTRFSNGSELVPPLATNQLDVGGGAPNAGLFNAMSRDVQLFIVADKGSTPPGYGFQGFVVRKDLVDSGKFKSPADLKGWKIATPQRGQSGEVSMSEILKQGGLTVNDVDLTVLPFPDHAAAYANNNIDAGSYIEPYITDGVAKGLISIYKRADEYAPNQQVAVIQYAPGFARKTDLATRFMVAYLKGVRTYNDAFAKKIPAVRQEVIDLLAQQTTLKDKSLYDKMGVPGLNPNGAVNVADLKHQQDYYLAAGLQKNAADIDKLVDPSFVQAAHKQLGEYK
ncbi:MAG TPA: ABC transporter substrate-binding protein [Chloroflexota bacterium]|nr:ABC transporter substrate-binding protein [Chloroflexota bacterium]